MIRLHRLALLSVPVAIGLLSAAMPGRAQTGATAPRFAFADTTLLRDTLGLSFDRLFPLADSLGMLPDTLRALSIRYQLPIDRLVSMADSMRTRVDSVGVLIDRERYNPLAANAVERATDFHYGTGYNVLQSRSTWTNSLDLRLVRGPLFFRNATNIQLDETQSVRSTTRRQTRRSENEVGWRVSPNASVGGRAVFNGFLSNDPSSINSVDEAGSNFQLSLRTKQAPSSQFRSELNAFTGYLDLDNTQQLKRGGSGEVNGNLTYNVGDKVTNDLNAQLVGNLSRVFLKTSLTEQLGHDLTQVLHATSTLYPAGRLSANADIGYRNFFVQTPDDSGKLQDARNGTLDLLGGVRMRFDNDRQLNVSQSYNLSTTASAQRSGQSDRKGGSFATDGRYLLLRGTLEGRFALDRFRSETPTLTDEGGYGEESETRALEGTYSRQLGRKLTGRLNGRISLGRYRYYTIGSYPSLPVPRDQTQQSVRMDGIYTGSAEFNTSLALEVQRNELVNLPSAAVNSNNLARNYRVEWNWTYRLLRSLTITQRNVVSANYVNYKYNELNGRLLLDYNTSTTLNALLSPRLTLDLTHYAQSQRSGNYLPDAASGNWFFLPADDTKNYQLGTRLTWSPSTALSLSIEPRYRSGARRGTTNGASVPTNDNENLTFNGNANLNLRLGASARLTGNLGRQYQDDRTEGFSQGISTGARATSTDYWIANLQFSWTM